MRRGIKTTEFWLSLLGPLVDIVLSSLIPDTWRPGLATAGTVGYAISRGVAKFGGKDVCDKESK